MLNNVLLLPRIAPRRFGLGRWILLLGFGARVDSGRVSQKY